MTSLVNLKERSFTRTSPMPPNSIRGVLCLVLKVFDQKESNKNMLSFTAILMHETEIPYIFIPRKREGKPTKPLSDASKLNPPKTNLIMEPVPGEISTIISAGGIATVFSIYKPASSGWELEGGNFYSMDGVYYDMFKLAEEDEPKKSFSCKKITPVEVVAEEIMSQIPFEFRSINKERDIVRASLNHRHDYRFVWVTVSAETQNSRVYGRFTVPNAKEALITTYVPYNPDKSETVAIIALTGGKRVQGTVEVTADNQFNLLQKNDTGESEMFMGLTKLYPESLLRLHMCWQTFAKTIFPFLCGNAFALIDPTKTASIEMDDPDTFAVCLNTFFTPDLAGIARGAGFKLQWDSCVLLDERMQNPVEMVSPVRVQSFAGLNAVNLLQFTGDITGLKEAEQVGYVEFYAFTNIFMNVAARAAFQAKSEQEVITELLDPTRYEDERVSVIFAVCTETSPCPVFDFVGMGKKPAKHVFQVAPKRAKIEEGQSAE